MAEHTAESQVVTAITEKISNLKSKIIALHSEETRLKKELVELSEQRRNESTK